MSSLTRIPLDSANVDIFSGLTKSVLKFYVSEDIVNIFTNFRNTVAEILFSEIRSIPLTKFKINWVHSLLKKTGTLDESWQFTQCLFGEHLLPQHPDKPIALVESEKTAIICSGLMPQYLWLATGGKSQLSQEKLSAAEIDITVSDILQRYATEEQRKAHIDIADLLIQWKQNGELIPGTPRKVQLNDSNDIEILLEKWFSSEYLPEIHNLINDLDLTPVTEEWLI